MPRTSEATSTAAVAAASSSRIPTLHSTPAVKLCSSRCATRRTGASSAAIARLPAALAPQEREDRPVEHLLHQRPALLARLVHPVGHETKVKIEVDRGVTGRLRGQVG